MPTSAGPLSVPNTNLTLTMGNVSITPPVGDAIDIVTETFESGDTLSSGYPNFDWTVMNKTSVVTMSAGGNPTILYTGSGATNEELVGDPRDWTALSGNNSLRVAYPQSTSLSEDEWAEQKWSLIGDYYPGFKEIWAKWSVRVPTNYYHRAPVGSENNKFCTFYCDGYTSADPTGGFVGFELWRDSSVEAGGSKLSVNCQGGTGGVTDNQGHAQKTPFIVPSDAGRWMHFCVQIILCKVHTDSDGQVRSWRKWDGEADWTLIHEKLTSNADEPDAGTGVEGVRLGYLMGWSNSGMDEAQEWLIDNFQLSTGSLL